MFFKLFMAECEVCGTKLADRKAIVENVSLDVCQDCAKLGKEIEIPAVEVKSSFLISKPVQKEEVLVDEYSKLIQQARQKSSLKQEELALKMKEKLASVQAAESGKRCDIKLARKFERFFNIRLIEQV